MSTIHTNPLEPFEPRARSLVDVHPSDDGTDDDNLASSILSNGPRLNAKVSSFANLTPKTEENWTIRKVPNGEEELYSKGKCVYYTRNSLVIKSFNFTEQVVKVFWAKFANSDHICIALNSGLSIFDKLGQHFQITIPFPYQNIYPTPNGLIIVRNCDSTEDSLPVVFAITHPTHDITPVLFQTTGYPRLVRFSMPTSNSIVTCHEEMPISLMQNSDYPSHTVWRIRRATTDEIKTIEKMYESVSNEANDLNNTCTINQSNSLRENPSQLSLSVSSKQRSSLMHQSNPSPANTINFSPKMDLRNRPSALGNLAASRLGVGYPPISSETTCPNVRSYNSAHSMNMMYTPNKNRRIINYLRDNIDEPILPELVFEKCWRLEPEDNTSFTRANKFFMISDMVDVEYMVLVCSGCIQLYVYKDESPNDNPFSNFDVGRTYTVPAIDAMPLPTMRMILVLDCNKNVVLHSGPNRLVSINLTNLPSFNSKVLPSSSPVATRQAPSDSTPIQMSSARKRSSIGERSSLGSDPCIQQMFKALSPVPHASQNEAKLSQLVHLNDIKRFDHVIGQVVYLVDSQDRRAKFEIPSLCQTRCVMSLLEAMNSVLSKENGLSMVSSWYQTRRSSQQPDLMHASEEMKLFKNWFLNSIGVGNNYFDTNERSRASELKLLHSSPTKKWRRIREMEANPMVTNLHTLFYAMHLVLEDLLLNKLNYSVANNLAELLLVIACLLKLGDYQSYYWVIFPDLQDKFGPQKSALEGMLNRPEALHKAPFFRSNPPSSMQFISKIIDRSQNNYFKDADEFLSPFHTIGKVTDSINTVISLFCTMFNLATSEALVSITDFNVVAKYRGISMKKINNRFTRSKEADERLVEMMVALKKDRNYLSCLPEGINLYLWDAILNCRESPPTNWDERCFRLIGRLDLVSLVKGQANLHLPSISSGFGDTQDETLKLLFPDDIRVSEAQRMLASDVPVEFNVTQRQGSTEEESRDETHRHLYLLNIRTMAMPVGRGAICLRTYSPVIGETFEVPKLELTGRAISEDRPIEYTHDISVYPWPFFHNGVAAGLTICSSAANNIIDSTWINYNRPRSNITHGVDMRDRDLATANINNEHAGFLFALGLNGHLEKLSLMALHDYLCQNNDLTKLAILLGMSAAKRGSRDNNIIKVLSIHVDALLPPNSTELDVPAPVHAAAIMGVGLLYESSGDSHISRVLLEEIGRLPGPEANSHVDRESYSLSAGLAFGLVNLCKGGSSTVSDQLRLYMLGGKRKTLSAAQRDRYFKQDCHRGEEEFINTHITCPGGALALGLMYHRSNNWSVARWMEAPDTQTLLEYVRPDFLAVRSLSLALIMWDYIQPKEDWIGVQVPTIVSTHAFQRNSPNGCLGSLESPARPETKIDFELLSQAYCYIKAGCCLAIALRYAGTANQDAYDTIYENIRMIISISRRAAAAEQAGRPCIEACFNILVTSLAVVMAGTGHLGVMRVCRYLRSRLSKSCVFYGSHMAIHMALGILFLGACRYSLSTSPSCVAALVCALYPIYPNHSSDNRYHLQALRHLYVLAAEPRLLIPRDIQTNRPVYVNVTVRRKSTSPEREKTANDGEKFIEIQLRAPCLMPELSTIESVCVDDKNYWRIEINSSEALMRCLLKDQGCLSVKRKAHSSNNQLVQDIEGYILQNMPKGVNKNRKSSALSECVREDRVEQYSALNELLTKSNCSRRAAYKSLILAQIRLASSLAQQEAASSIQQPANDGSDLLTSSLSQVCVGDNSDTSNIRRLFINKMHLLRPLIGDYSDQFEKEKVHDLWCDYVCRHTDWTSASKSVAHYIVLNELYPRPIDRELEQTLRQLSFR